MKPRWPVRYIRWVGCLAALLVQPLIAEETESESFRSILELAELGPDVIGQLGAGPDYSEQDWQLLLQVSNRLLRFNDPNPLAPHAASLSHVDPKNQNKHLGEVVRVGGLIVSVEQLPLPEQIAKAHPSKSVFRCQLRFLVSDGFSSGEATVLATDVPKHWHTKQDAFHEGVQLRGVLVQFAAETGEPVILTNHLAWFPESGVPTGQLLLARHGMDVALLDEVRHHQPFVKPEISREGEAFYAALTALDKADQSELLELAQANVVRMADEWRARQPNLRSDHQTLQEQLTKTSDQETRKELAAQIKQAKNQRGLAATVVKQAEAGQSSVAPMFLQPEQQVGELFYFAGTARRAVRIAVQDQPDLNAYYELEIFPAESQLLNNQPVVCCVHDLPTGFPIGDEIREPVRISGVFFKSWRYRSRNVVGQAGQTGRQRQLYTPVVLAKLPIWLNKTDHSDSGWAFWGGVAFLGGLATLWISMTWLARRDRVARAELRPNRTIDL